LMTTMRVVGECFFWYRLTRVFPDKFHRAVKRLCVLCVHRFATIQNITDRQMTDRRDSVPKARLIVRSAKNGKCNHTMLTAGETNLTSGDNTLLVVDVTLEADCSDRLRPCCLVSMSAAAAAAAAMACCCSCNSRCLAMHEEYTSATFCTMSSTKLCQYNMSTILPSFNTNRSQLQYSVVFNTLCSSISYFDIVGHSACKKPCNTYPQRFCLEQMEEEK